MLGAIAHPGIVVDVREDHIKVKIESTSACAACHIRGSCTTADKAEKIIEVKPDFRLFRVGDHVEIVMSEVQGLRAVLVAYVIPAVLIFFILFFGMLLAHNELIVGGVIVLTLATYYTILFLLKDHIKKQISFYIKK